MPELLILNLYFSVVSHLSLLWLLAIKIFQFLFLSLSGKEPAEDSNPLKKTRIFLFCGKLGCSIFTFLRCRTPAQCIYCGITQKCFVARWPLCMHPVFLFFILFSPIIHSLSYKHTFLKIQSKKTWEKPLVCIHTKVYMLSMICAHKMDSRTCVKCFTLTHLVLSSMDWGESH